MTELKRAADHARERLVPAQEMRLPETGFLWAVVQFHSEGKRLASTDEAAMWDARNLLQRWLEMNGEITFRAEYPQVQVTRYKLTQK